MEGLKSEQNRAANRSRAYLIASSVALALATTGTYLSVARKRPTTENEVQELHKYAQNELSCEISAIDETCSWVNWVHFFDLVGFGER